DRSAAERYVALVFQYYSLYPRDTVRQNLEFPLKSKVRNYSAAEIGERVARAAKTLRIEHLLERKTDRLSGGEMQRVSIGRAIVHVGTPFEIYNRPTNVFVASFVGSPAMNLLPAELDGGKVTALSGKVEAPLPALKQNGVRSVTIGIRSEDVRVGSGEAAEARVHHVENHGVEKIVTLRVGDHLFNATVPATLNVAVDGTVRFGFNPQKLHY